MMASRAAVRGVPAGPCPAARDEGTGLPERRVSGGGGLWAITAYFNPAGFRRRLANYRLFRKHLAVPLVAVELAYGPDFELSSEDADILIRLRGRDVMWQKERLLNIAIESLPSSCTTVAWLDCDLIFADEGWAERTRAALERFALVQPFTCVHRMPQAWRPGDQVAGADPLSSIRHLLSAGMSVDECVHMDGEAARCARGMAWAARRGLLERYRLFDQGVLGGGDALFFRAAFGYLDEAERRLCMRGRWAESYRSWAAPFHDAVRGSVGDIPGDVFHLWHGEITARRYGERFRDFEAFGFDPAVDIAYDRCGAWRWASDKPEMHDFARRYFDSRREDG